MAKSVDTSMTTQSSSHAICSSGAKAKAGTLLVSYIHYFTKACSIFFFFFFALSGPFLFPWSDYEFLAAGYQSSTAILSYKSLSHFSEVCTQLLQGILQCSTLWASKTFLMVMVHLYISQTFLYGLLWFYTQLRKRYNNRSTS